MMDISRMQEKAPGHFHKGFYLTENIISSFWAIENEYTEWMSYEDSEIVDRLFPDAEVFLHGSCGLMERDIEQDRRLENEGDAIGLRFARDIVKKYRSYYDISF